MDNLNIPSYNSLIPKERMIKALQELYNFIHNYKQLVDEFMATSSEDFKGTYDSLQELEAVEANANDYGYVVTEDPAGNNIYNRYRYVEGTGWVYEYSVTNPIFTTEEWNAIRSGITADLVKYEDVYIGVAASSATVIDDSYHHASIMRGRPVAIDSVSGFIWTVLPANYSPVVAVSFLEVPMTLDSTTTIEGKSYNIWKSVEQQTGPFNIYLF